MGCQIIEKQLKTQWMLNGALVLLICLCFFNLLAETCLSSPCVGAHADACKCWGHRLSCVALWLLVVYKFLVDTQKPTRTETLTKLTFSHAVHNRKAEALLLSLGGARLQNM